MKKGLLIGIILTAVCFIGIILVRFNLESNKKVSKNRELVSPVPKTLASFFIPKVNSVLGESSVWFPDEKKILGTKQPLPIITADSAISVDLTTKQVLFEKNSKIRHPIASIVKIMTALIALENAPLDKEITVSYQAATIGEDSMGITTGERYTLRDLLYGLMLVSGNDAAEAIAEGIAGRREIFITLMNAMAVNLGLKDTKFVNPSGLEEEGEQYSTAYDVTILTQYVLEKFPEFGKIVDTKEYIIPYTSFHKQIFLTNETNLLRTYPGVKGVKSGYTPSAGLCLVTLAENGGKRVLTVVLESGDRRGDMVKLLDFSFSSLGVLVNH